jgi:hypothetical protein
MRRLLYGVIGAFAGAIALGLVGFILGFFGPMILSPAAAQGPLMAFLTTPLGVLVGIFAGAGYVWIKGFGKNQT